MTLPPLVFTWDGEAMRPRLPKRADQLYTVGASYVLEETHDRSMLSHRHYFASINNAWMSLPEKYAEIYPSPEILRKKALIYKGYRDERTIVCASRAEAERVAAFCRPMDDYAIVLHKHAVVVVWTARSQSMKAMGKAEFQKSKDDVLDFCASLLDVQREALEDATP